MPPLQPRSSASRKSGGERVFSDPEGRLWSAAFTRGAERDGAIVFSCISDPRNSMRAIAAENDLVLNDAGDDTLRSWLHDAPRIGSLT